MISLEELERDALTELVNIGVSRAAVSLRKMVGQQISLSVPAIELLSSAEVADLIWQREAGPVVTVTQMISGPFSGRGLLIFPDKSGRALARILAGDALSEQELREFEDEALAETGNIVLNACIGSIGNMLRQRINLSTPSIARGSGDRLFDDLAPSPDGVVLFLHINFGVESVKIAGYLALVMDLPSLTALKTVIGEFIERAIGGS
jgi:chemotaxis protein CheC